MKLKTMNTKILKGLILFIIIPSTVYGNPLKNLKHKLIESRNLLKKDRNGNDVFFKELFNGINSTTESRRSYNTKELIVTCKHRKGVGRKLCVASFIRKQFPDVFRQRIKGSGRQRQTKQLTTTMATTLTVSFPTAQATAGTTCDPRIEKIENIASDANDVIQGDSVMSSAVLIVPGDKKKVTSIIQDQEANGRRVNDVAVKPVTCRREEFGFADHVDPKIVDIASDMLCSLCQEQGDGLCIVRWCFNI